MVNSMTGPITNHGKIRKWADEQGLRPCRLKGMGKEDSTEVLGFLLPNESEGGVYQEVSWEEFFANFEDFGLALITHRLGLEGGVGQPYKFVPREVLQQKVS